MGFNKLRVTLEKKFPDPAGLIGGSDYKDICQAAALYKGDQTEIFMPDVAMKVYWKDDVMEFLDYDEIDKIVYVPESMDCDDFARMLFGREENSVSLLWTYDHAMNYWVSPDGVLYYIEPQNDLVSVNLEGLMIRFFIAS
jgi:hypothetical protein